MSANLLLYAVDLDELRAWIGAGEGRYREALETVRSAEDSDWDPEELVVIQRLTRRLVVEGALYAGLADEERYYLTQILIDLFDEYVDQDAISEDIPLQKLVAVMDGLPPKGEAAKYVRWLVRGREIGGEGNLWTRGDVTDCLSYLGYVTRDEVGPMGLALDAAMKGGPGGRRPSGLLKALRHAAGECERAGLDLVSFVG